MTGNTQPFHLFVRVWLGQLMSLLGSAMTRFALTIYMWQVTGEATPVILIGVFASLPSAVVSLWAGVLVDRWNRKYTLMLADIGSASATVILLAFFILDSVQTWQIYLAVAIGGVCNTFQWLAFSSTLSSLVSRRHLSRANGMMSLAEYVALVGAPILAGILLPLVDIQGILIFDIVSFLFAVLTIAFTTFRLHSQQADEAQPETERFLSGLSFGFRYIARQRPFMALLVVLILFGAIEAVGYTLLAPMILARSGGSEAALATVQAVMGIGGIVGGILISAWGGPRKRIYGLLTGIALTGLLGDALMGFGQGLAVWIIAGFAVEFFIPLIISSHRGIWQSKVPPKLQGRIFATLGFMISLSEPIASLLAGTLADNVLEPAMRSESELAIFFAPLVGVGEGAGMALLFIFSGVLLGFIGFLGMLIPILRNLETKIPDYDESQGL
ncbi:MFS transporter [Anaerolineae bacterium CFX9]|nr:MFS transporter [Anaerolineae bacterium CFX9]